jgi:hypothetical protein
MIMKNKIELLMPAGDLTRLKVSLLYGADAVFIGGKKFSLRAKASNFSIEDIAEGVKFAHSLNKKIYVTVNIIPHCDDLNNIEEYLLSLDRIHVDAIIVSSLFIIETVKKLNLNLECHVSTQVSAVNEDYVKFYEELGCTRVVLARECSLNEIRKIKEHTNSELEVFIQGGLCSSYSGKCTLSNYFVCRDANRGGCAHSCRWDYKLYQNNNLISEDIFKIASKDLMGIRLVKDLIEIGVSSLKVEGRMKSVNYVALVGLTYRKIIDAICENRLTEDLLLNAEKVLKSIESRPLTQGFLNKNGISYLDQIYANESTMVNKSYLGYVVNEIEDYYELVRKNDIRLGSEIEVFCYDQEPFITKIIRLWDKDGDVILANKTENGLFAKFDKPLKKYYILRCK